MTGIGERISNLRKQKNVTQDELGKALGVTMQAVSRWENGGMPDVMLLPAMADYFGASIDELFGRKPHNENAQQAILRQLQELPAEKRLTEALSLCFQIHRGCLFAKEYLSEDEFVRLMKSDRTNSRIDRDAGITEMRLGKQQSWFFISPEPENGRYESLYNRDEHTKLFKLLSAPDAYDALILILTRIDDAYTGKLLVKNLNITEERADEILHEFARYELVEKSNLELDDEKVTIYRTAYSVPHVIPFLTFAQQIIDSPHAFNYQSYDREKPYLTNPCK